MKRMPMKTANMQKGTEMGYARPHTHDIPTDQAAKIVNIEIRLPIGHTIGMVRRAICLSPTWSRKSWDCIVDKIMRLLTATEVAVRVVSLD